MGTEGKKETKETSVFVENMAILATPEGVQKYILGTKKNGSPRAVYDVIKDFAGPDKKKGKKKKKKSNGSPSSTYAFYLDSKKSKKKKKNKNKHWHI